MCDCSHLVLAEVHLFHPKDPGNEEISSSRWAQYILKFSRSHSEESYDPDSALQKNINSCKKLQNLVKKLPRLYTKTADLYTSKNMKLYICIYN